MVVAVVGIGIVAGGFLNFVYQVQGAEPLGLEAPAEAIVVLTGGPNRIDAGLELLADGRAKRMLISGVGGRASAAALGREAARPVEAARLFACCVDLGRAALDTLGNAEEARDWIRRNGYRDVLVVTADYHMPRAMLEFRRALAPPAEEDAEGEVDAEGGEDAEGAEQPDPPQPVFLRPWPVPTPLVRQDDWYRDPAAIRRLGGEWIKYLSAQSRGWFGSEVLKTVLSPDQAGER